MKPTKIIIRLAIASTLILAATAVTGMEPPTADQLERYRQDGTLAARADAARAFGNHRMAPALAARLGSTAALKALPDAPSVLPSEGSPRVLTLLIAFSDMLGVTDPAAVDDRIFGDGEASAYPYESLTNFYRRASFGQLEITGSTLGWYTTAYPRSEVGESYVGRQALIKEAFTYYDGEGHDFSQYDNDGDGVIDYLAIVWTGEHGEWAEFWWGYQTSFYNDNFTVDGVRIGTYSWQWENYNWPGEFSPEVIIHETGHALGLPDYYDYDDAIGPKGGVGGMDQMDGNWGDHNAFSKWVLGWLEPRVFNEGPQSVVLSPTDEFPSAAVFMHGDPVTDPAAEYFLVQSRRQEGNDAELPNRGVLIWHVDARTDAGGNFLYDNSYTDHKLLRLMEADGLEEIEQGGRADAEDFYSTTDEFGPNTFPNSNRYDGVPTNFSIEDISLSWAGPDILLTVDLGSGCALWCDASVTPNAWPGFPVSFNGSLETANCEGTPSYGWVFGDGAASGDTSASHAYVSTGSYTWSVTAELEDAVCGHQGSLMVCTELPCWQWTPAEPMAAARGNHVAVTLADGRLLVVGGSNRSAEIYDPESGAWSAAAEPPADFDGARAERLDDGRVLVVGANASNPFPSVTTGIYDPVSDSWSATGQLTPNRFSHSAVKLDDGRVMVVGGLTGEWPHATEAAEVMIFDPASETWAEVGRIERRLLEPGLAKLHDGRVLIVGGREMTLFDPVAMTLTRAAPLPDDWQRPIAVTLTDGRVLLANPTGGTRTLIWNPSDRRWQLAGDLGGVRGEFTATMLPAGLVLVAGGRDLSYDWLRSTELFDPALGAWIAGASFGSARGAHTANLTDDGRLLVVGGYGPDGSGGSASTAGLEVLTRPASPPRGAGGRVLP